jgi:hypothetical protein
MMQKITVLVATTILLLFISEGTEKLKKDINLSIDIKLEKEIGNPNIFEVNVTDLYLLLPLVNNNSPLPRM